MTTLLITQVEVRRLLPLAECIDAMAAALAQLANGEALSPLRSVTILPDGQSAFAMMPAWCGPQRVVGAKVITAFNGNNGTPYDSHQGAVLLFETSHGRLLAIVDATAITTIRTAAVSAVATRLLAREDARVLAILGAGVQARAHLEAIAAVRPLGEVRIWSRTSERARELAREAAERCGGHAYAVATAEEAVRGADIVCTTTSAVAPVLEGDWLQPGTHVNAIGACVPFARELDTAAVVRARLYVDRRDAALREPGDLVEPLRAGAITPAHIVGEIGDVLTGRAPGRRAPDEITLFKSLGLAVEDVAAARLVYDRAVRDQVGTAVELGGLRES